MSSRLVVGLLGGVSCLLVSALSQAQCSKDTDCKGERVCEAGACVSPSPSASAPSDAAAPPAVAPPAAPSSAPVAPAPVASTPVSPAEQPPQLDLKPKRNWRRHSTGMMAGGIVMTSFVPIALIVALVANSEQNVCEGNYFSITTGERTQGVNCGRYDPTIYGSLISAAVLLGVGVPLIIIGGKREPLGTAQIRPWATAQAGGLSLRLDL